MIEYCRIKIFFQKIIEMIKSKYAVNAIAFATIGCAIEVHSYLGPGLLESVYHSCLIEELKIRGYAMQSKLLVPIFYKGTQIESPLILDLLIEESLVVELKSVEQIHPVHKAQLLSYLRLAQKPKGLLINFNVEKLVSGVTHIVSESFATLDA